MIRKKRADEIDRTLLAEFLLTSRQRAKFLRGVALFNRQKFWDSHEAWEAVWHEREEEGRIFFQGLVQAAAAYHLIVVRPRFGGARRNVEKALTILDLFPGRYLGVDVTALRRALRRTGAWMDEHGGPELERFPPRLVPQLNLVVS